MPVPLSNTYRPEVHGHRGCRGLRPENTLPAFLHALSLGVDVLEMDVVISADNQVVVSHEPWLNPRICLDPLGQIIQPSAAGSFNLYQMPYAIIRRCDCGQLRHPEFPSQVSGPAYKPLLREVLAAIEAATQQLGRTPVGYSIEVKSGPEGDAIYHPSPEILLPLVLAELAIAQVMPRTTLLCFDTRILQLAHRQQPALATCLLVEDDLLWPLSIRQLGFVPTTFGPDFRSVTEASVQELRSEFPGLRLVPWTVNTVPEMERLQGLHVDGMTTDYPDLLIAMLRSVAG